MSFSISQFHNKYWSSVKSSIQLNFNKVPKNNCIYKVISTILGLYLFLRMFSECIASDFQIHAGVN